MCVEVCQRTGARLRVLRWPTLPVDSWTGCPVNEQLLSHLLAEAGLQCRWFGHQWMVVGTAAQLDAWSAEETLSYQSPYESSLRTPESFQEEVVRLFSVITFGFNGDLVEVRAPAGLMGILKLPLRIWGGETFESRQQTIDNDTPLSLDELATYLQIAYRELQIEARSPKIVARAPGPLFKRIARDLFEVTFSSLSHNPDQGQCG